MKTLTAVDYVEFTFADNLYKVSSDTGTMIVECLSTPSLMTRRQVIDVEDDDNFYAAMIVAVDAFNAEFCAV